MTKQLTKLLVLFLTLVLCNCQQEDDVLHIQNEDITKSLYKQRRIPISKIPEIKNFIITKTNDEVFGTENTKSNQAIFDEANVLAIIDTLNNINYSLQFRYADTPIGEFYNLVVGKSPTGEMKTPFVLKLTSDVAYLDQFIANGFDMTYFKGNVELHKYTDYFQVGQFAMAPETSCPPNLDDVGDPIPCETQPIDGGPNGGGSENEGRRRRHRR